MATQTQKLLPALDETPLTIHCFSMAKLCTLQFVLNYTGKEKSVFPGEPLRTCWGKLSILITEKYWLRQCRKGITFPFLLILQNSWPNRTPAALFRQPVRGGCRPCWRSFCKSAGKISLGLKEANLNIACVQKL